MPMLNEAKELVGEEEDIVKVVEVSEMEVGWETIGVDIPVSGSLEPLTSTSSDPPPLAGNMT